MKNKESFKIPYKKGYLKLINYNCNNCYESTYRTPYEIKKIEGNFFNCDWCNKEIRKQVNQC